MRMFRLLLPFVSAFLFLQSAALANSLKVLADEALSDLYTYLYFQELSMFRVADDFPELALQVMQVRNRFDARLPNILAKVEARMRGSIMGSLELQEIRNRLSAFLDGQDLGPEDALTALAEFGRRANGDIESPILEQLLAVQYADNPAGEFIDGWRNRFETNGSGGAKGIRLALQVPRSWAGRQDGTPHLVQKWRSGNGEGPGLIQLMVFDASGWNLGNRGLEGELRGDKLRRILPPGWRVLDSGAFPWNGQNVVWLETSGNLEVGDIGVYTRGLTYQFLHQDRLVQMTCNAGGAMHEGRQTDAAFERMRPLCRQVLNSVVLLRNY